MYNALFTETGNNLLVMDATVIIIINYVLQPTQICCRMNVLLLNLATCLMKVLMYVQYVC